MVDETIEARETYSARQNFRILSRVTEPREQNTDVSSIMRDADVGYCVFTTSYRLRCFMKRYLNATITFGEFRTFLSVFGQSSDSKKMLCFSYELDLEYENF